jgi:hypothetical protein
MDLYGSLVSQLLRRLVLQGQLSLPLWMVLNGRIVPLRYFLLGVPQSHGTAAYGSLEVLEQIHSRIHRMVLAGLRRLLGMGCLQGHATQSLQMERNGSREEMEQINWRIPLMG